MGGIRALAIDFSGTLASPGPNPDGSCVAEVVAGLPGCTVPADFADVFDAVNHEVRYADRLADLHTPFATVVRRAAERSGAVVPDPVAAAEAVFAALPDAVVDAHAADAVRELHRRGWRCVLACNTERSAVARRSTLVAAGIADCFAAAVLSSEVGFRKPNPEFYAIVARECAVPAGQILFVGDNLTKDVLGPRAYGMNSVRVARYGGAHDRGPAADVLGHIAELPRYLEAVGASPA